MKKILSLLLYLLPFLTQAQMIDNGIFVEPEIKLSFKQIKFEKGTVRTFGGGHGGHDYYGIGKYKINEKDSTITLKYKKISVENHPVKNFCETLKVKKQGDHWVLSNFKLVQSEFALLNFEDNFKTHKEYVDKTYELRKKEWESMGIKK